MKATAHLTLVIHVDVLLARYFPTLRRGGVRNDNEETTVTSEKLLKDRNKHSFTTPD